MEEYNFDKLVPRKNTDCAKWDAAEYLFHSKEILPMWVADMDFPVAKPITRALIKRTEHEIYGYPMPEPKSVVNAVIQRMKKKYDWDIKPEWVIFTPGVVPALYSIIRSLTVPGDAIIHQDPVYYPFWSAIEDNGCHVLNNPLQLSEGKYRIDFEQLNQLFLPRIRMMPLSQRVRAMVLCNPHNPVGRVWTMDELSRMGEMVIANKAVLISDEIHCELLFKGHKHIPFASISDEFAQHSITCLAPSKTFNLAGLEASVVIIPNSELRESFKTTRKGFLPSVNVFGLVAMEAAFNEGDDWLEQVLAYLQTNLEFLMDYFKKRIPKIKVIRPEGTYLVWLDCRELGMKSQELERFMNQEAKVGLDHGIAFGPSGDGFERINIACPRSLLEEALQRIEKAVSAL
jgi:cysteine-S-conjugate beta-lyase